MRSLGLIKFAALAGITLAALAAGTNRADAGILITVTQTSGPNHVATDSQFITNNLGGSSVFTLGDVALEIVSTSSNFAGSDSIGSLTVNTDTKLNTGVDAGTAVTVEILVQFFDALGGTEIAWSKPTAADDRLVLTSTLGNSGDELLFPDGSSTTYIGTAEGTGPGATSVTTPPITFDQIVGNVEIDEFDYFSGPEGYFLRSLTRITLVSNGATDILDTAKVATTGTSSVTVVPEPNTLAVGVLATLGFLGYGIRRRKRA